MNTETKGGIGLMTIIGIILIALKLTGNIAISWLWVLAPFWLPTALGLLALVFGFKFFTKKR